jgi:hypothetical protein
LTVLTALAWPVNALILALAVRVSKGRKKLDIPGGELGWRCFLGSLGLAVFALLFVGADYLLAESAEMPAGIVELLLLFTYMLAAIGFLYWALALEDLGQALTILFLYVLLPGVPLLIAGRFLGLWPALRQAAPWFLIS